MHFSSPDFALAQQLDVEDELAGFAEQFSNPDPDLLYLDGNSLGRLPKATPAHLQQALTREWGARLIRGWNDGWLDLPQRLGAQIAALIGAQPDEVLVCDSTSVNLFKLAAAALRYQNGRPKLLSDDLNFPSDLYIFQGLVDLLGGGRRLELAQTSDGIEVSQTELARSIDAETALVSLSLVAFKSGFLYDMKAVNLLAQSAGALTLWDLSHAAGAVPVDLNGSRADLAVGCTYKYINGGPGAPAFLYVRKDLQAQLNLPLWGWFAAQAPFAFGLDFEPAGDIRRFQVGTPPVLALRALEPALEILQAAGIPRLRRKSVLLTEYVIYLADQWLAPLGFTLGSPRAAERRGSHVALRHPHGYQMCRALIEAAPPAPRVIPDFRAPDTIRLGIAPLYNHFSEIHRALSRLRQVAETGEYAAYPAVRQGVT